MLTGALGMKLVPADFFGVVERFSVFAATGFNAALGVAPVLHEAGDRKQVTMRIRLYPRPRDQQIVYLKDVIESPNIKVGEYTIYNDFVHDL